MELDRDGAEQVLGETPGAGPWRDPLRWLFVPWTVLVFFPFLLATTALWGCLAAALSPFSQRAAFHCGTVWAKCLAWVSFVRVRVEGRESARPGQSYVIMTNHQGDYDVVALYGYLHLQFRWVIKQELRKVPVLGWACEAIGHIFIDRGSSRRAIASLEAAKPRLAGGVSVLFFPEGTRSPDGRLGPFKKGGFAMARQLGLPILPVSLAGSWKILPKGCLFPRPGTIQLRFHPPVLPADHPGDDTLMAAVRTAIAAGIEADRSTVLGRKIYS
jgi:1-acyl-sn-glycerol-3-phosphate acyltransferase